MTKTRRAQLKTEAKHRVLLAWQASGKLTGRMMLRKRVSKLLLLLTTVQLKSLVK